MLTIRCAKCRNKLFHYEKIGHGRVLRCYKDLISHDQSIIENNLLTCKCSNIIGVDKGLFFQMKANEFIYSGKKKNS